MQKHFMNSTALATALLGKTPESMPRVKLSEACVGQCLVVFDSAGRVGQLSPWNLKAA